MHVFYLKSLDNSRKYTFFLMKIYIIMQLNLVINFTIFHPVMKQIRQTYKSADLLSYDKGIWTFKEFYNFSQMVFLLYIHPYFIIPY